jgi:malate dehydrogenase (oxaloacetate-decarboxylating)(NADP+)
MKIPVFHDDQHGTAIVVGARVLNALRGLGQGHQEGQARHLGAGAAALACVGLLVKLGLPRENIWLTDLAGVVYEGRTELMDEDKDQFTQKTSLRTLREVIAGADIFPRPVGRRCAEEGDGRVDGAHPGDPRARPTRPPRSCPKRSRRCAPTRIIATGRTDYPNQVNNVLCFPYIFRGALDSGRDDDHGRDGDRRGACDRRPAQAEQSEVVAAAYAGVNLSFGPEYLIPKPFDPATDDEDRAGPSPRPRPIRASPAAGRRSRGLPREAADLRLCLGHDDEADLHARPSRRRTSASRLPKAKKSGCCARCRWWSTKTWRRPTLIGRPEVIAQRCEKFGLRLKAGKDYDLVSTEQDDRYRDYWQTYHQMTARKGVTAQLAKIEMRRRLTLIAAMMLHKGEVDGMLCGTWGSTGLHLQYVDQVIGLREGAKTYACMNGLILPAGR